MHPFQGGETHAKIRLKRLLTLGFVTTYPSTCNRLLDVDSTSKLSGYLALGCITSRQIHALLAAFEDGVSTPETEDWKGAPGFGGGENEGTTLMRVELLWRDYMHFSTRKFGHRLFCLEGFKQVEGVEHKWARPDKPIEGLTKKQVAKKLERFLNGTTGMGLIDASQREVYTKLVSSSYIYLLALTPAFRPRFRGWPPCFMKKFSFSDGSVWPGKCRPISAQVLSSWTNLANRISCSFVSSLPGFLADTTR
jgi:hypothetical protein